MVTNMQSMLVTDLPLLPMGCVATFLYELHSLSWLKGDEVKNNLKDEDKPHVHEVSIAGGF